MSKCSNSNLLEGIDWLELNVNFFCLVKWHMSQVVLLSNEKEKYKWDICVSLLWDKWLNLNCHLADIELQSYVY